MGVHTANNQNSDPGDEKYAVKASEMKDLRHPAKWLYQNELHLDKTIVSNEDSEEDDFHSHFTVSRPNL